MQRMRGDGGAVAVLVAVLFPTVLLGMGALTLDFGALYAEKRQLQNGADAGALAAAREYAAAGPGGCVVGGKADLADDYADQNANDSFGSNIDSMECPAANEVRVTASSNSSGGAFIAPLMAQALGYGSTTLTAVASATWGPPSGLTSGLPLVISLCEFNFYAGAGLAVGPPFDPALETVLHFHTQDQTSGCPSSQSGADAPGGFGWIETAESTCTTSTSLDDPTLSADTGTDVPQECSSAYLESLLNTVVDVPVFDSTNGLSGNNIEYNLIGYVGFYLTGYRLSGDPAYNRDESSLSPSEKCTGNERCIYGYFTRDLTPTTGTVGSSPPMGVTVIQMTE